MRLKKQIEKATMVVSCLQIVSVATAVTLSVVQTRRIIKKVKQVKSK
jgi:hypothetical protein